MEKNYQKNTVSNYCFTSDSISIAAAWEKRGVGSRKLYQSNSRGKKKTTVTNKGIKEIFEVFQEKTI